MRVSHFCEHEPGPPRHHEPERRSVHGVDRTVVLAEGNEHVVGHRLRDRHPAGDGELVGLAREVGVRPDVRGVDHPRLDPARGEHVLEAHPRPARARDRPPGPLAALGGRVEEGPPVPAALDRERHGDHLELRPEVGDRIRHGAVDEAVDGEGPRLRLHLGGRNAVVADEVARGRGDRVVEEVRRGLRVDRAVVEEGEPVLAHQHVLVGERGGDEPRRHVAVERDRRAHHRRHRREPGAPEEATPVRARLAAEEGAVGGDRVLREELVEVLAAHRVRGFLIGHDDSSSRRCRRASALREESCKPLGAGCKAGARRPR